MNLHTCGRKLRTAWRVWRTHGSTALWHLSRQKLARRPHMHKTDLFAHYDAFLRLPPAGQACASPPAPRTVNWVVPMYGRGSGGHLNIFRFVGLLEARGFECRIVVLPANGIPPPSPARAAAEISAWFQPLKAQVFTDLTKAPPARITVATAWETAYHVRAFRPTLRRCYFVQDFEPWFFAPGTEHALAEATYRFGFHGITAGSWLRDKLVAEYGMTADSLGFSYDHALYAPQERGAARRRQVFFYARPPTPRRGFELGLLALAEVTRRLPDVRVVFAGWDVSTYRIPFDHDNYGMLPVERLPELYNQCEAALVLSFSNLSLLPLELMACGTPVVSNRGPWVEWLLNGEVAEFADSTPEALADALCRVLENPARQASLRENGLALARSTSWEEEGRRLASILERLGA